MPIMAPPEISPHVAHDVAWHARHCKKIDVAAAPWLGRRVGWPAGDSLAVFAVAVILAVTASRQEMIVTVAA